MTVPANELVGLPVGGPTSRALVKAWLGIAEDDERDDAKLDGIVAAVNNIVRGMRCSQAAVGADAFPPSVEQGATMLAGRYHRRRLSPAGVEAFGSDGAVFIRNSDPDVAQMLGIGSYQPPTVG